MIRRIIAHLLCVSLSWMTVYPAYASPIAVPLSSSADMSAAVSAESLKIQYPDARVVRVSESEYPQLAQSLSDRGYRPVDRLAVNLSSDAAPLTSTLSERERMQRELEKEYQQQNKNECSDSTPAVSSDESDDSFRAALDISDSLMRGGSGNDDAAAVLFIVVGAIVLFVWAFYVVKYLADLAIGKRPCGRWSDLTFTSSSGSRLDQQYANFNGIRYQSGFRDGHTDIGISAELGMADILLTEINAAQPLEGIYWMFGPLLRWRLSSSENPATFNMSFEVGSTEHDEMGIIALAKMGLNFGISDAMRLGLNLGAMNINLHDDQGFIENTSQYYMLYGVNFGYRF